MCVWVCLSYAWPPSPFLSLSDLILEAFANFVKFKNIYCIYYHSVFLTVPSAECLRLCTKSNNLLKSGTP